MRKSYIAKGAEALNLHNGNQTAIVVKMKVQPTPNKFNPQNVDFEMSKGDRRHKGTSVNPNNLNCPLLGILDMSPYQIGQEVYVRESWCMPDDEYFYKSNGMQKNEHYLWDGIWQPSATMPKDAARTRLKIVGCGVVRVQEITEEQAKQLSCERLYEDNLGQTFKSHKRGFERDIISKFGQSAWDNNDYIWYYKIEKI